VSFSRVELTVKALALVPVPAALVMLMAPVVAPLGTVVLTWLSETTVKLAAVPLTPTALAPLNPLPVSVTEVPTGPLVGANELITGAEMTVKALPLTPVPAPFVASLCFGGGDRRDLYVTTSGNSDHPERRGTVFRTRANVPGLVVPLARV